MGLFLGFRGLVKYETLNHGKWTYAIQKITFLTWIRRFYLKRLIFGFLVPFEAEFRRLKKIKKTKMISKQLWLQGTDIMHFIRVFPCFFLSFDIAFICTYMLVPLVGPGGACDHIYICIWVVSLCSILCAFIYLYYLDECYFTCRHPTLHLHMSLHVARDTACFLENTRYSQLCRTFASCWAVKHWQGRGGWSLISSTQIPFKLLCG